MKRVISLESKNVVSIGHCHQKAIYVYYRKDINNVYKLTKIWDGKFAFASLQQDDKYYFWSDDFFTSLQNAVKGGYIVYEFESLTELAEWIVKLNGGIVL